LVISAVVACKGKPKPQAAPGSGKVETQGSASKGAKEIELPHSDGSRPIQTTGPVKLETLKKMSEITFPGFNLDVRSVVEKHMWVYQKTAEHPIIRASIHIWPCDEKNCWPLDLAKYKERQEELKIYLEGDLKTAPDTQFEVGQTEVNGAPVMYTFQLGQVMNDKRSQFTYAYVMFYNDGKNEIRVVSEYKDDMVATKEDMIKAVPKEDLENTAKAMIDVYTHHWQE
jgi:hypothetical protein